MKIRHIQIKNFRGIKSLSWHVKGDFNCIIGAGDTCKTTILEAVHYALYPGRYPYFHDSDFLNQDFEEDIVIQITLSNWDEERPEIRKFFQERKFAQFKCGIDETGPSEEPESDDQDQIAVSVCLHVDKSLEPEWFVVKGLYEKENEENRKKISATDRAVFGASHLDVLSDFHFSWGRNSILTRLGEEHPDDLRAVMHQLARDIKQTDISGTIAECNSVADTVKKESVKAGVMLKNLSPKIDIQRQPINAGVLSLHEDEVPLRNRGSGSKKLITAAMQMNLCDGKNISLVDEIEMGLEPQRIRGLILRLKNSGQQIFTTTHSPVVLRELNVSDNELYLCIRKQDGTVRLESLASAPDIQGAVRKNAEAFLGSKIIVCEGATEIGCLRAYDNHRFREEDMPAVWSLATSYFDANGGGNIKPICKKLLELGYRVAVLCDNDTSVDLNQEKDRGIHVCQWGSGNSTEKQLFSDCPWDFVPELLRTIVCTHGIEMATVVDCIRKDSLVSKKDIADDPDDWPESAELRKAIGAKVQKHSLIKRIGYAEKAFSLALPKLPEETVLASRLNDLWKWIQHV